MLEFGVRNDYLFLHFCKFHLTQNNIKRIFAVKKSTITILPIKRLNL